MKKITILFSIIYFVIGTINGQNIPRANHTGPYGVQVNTYTGNFYTSRMDLFIPNQGISLDISFAYNSFRDTIDYGYGKGWTFSLGMCYEVDSTNAIILHHPDGRRDRYIPNGNEFTSPEGIFDVLTKNGDNYQLKDKYGMEYQLGGSTHQSLTQIKEPNGNTLSLSYENKRPVSIIDASGRAVALIWGNEHLLEIIDDNTTPSRKIQYAYNAAGQLQTVTDPLGNTMQYQYNELSQLNNLINENGEFLKVGYSSAGRVIQLRSCISVLNFSYDELKSFVVEEGGNRQITTYTYTEDGKLQSKTGSCCGYNTQYEYDTDNNLANFTDANGTNFQSVYDASGNVLQSKDALGGQLQLNYADELNRLTQITDKRGNSIQMDYDNQGNLTQISQPEGIEMSFDYDDKGNLEQFKDGRNNETNLVYNANNDVIEISYPIGKNSFSYDGVGNLSESTDPNGHSTKFEYDVLNRVTMVRDALNYEYQFAYDAASNLTQEIDANGNQKEYGYDPHNRLVSVKTPTGTTYYEYDSFNNLAAVEDANGHRSTYIYDNRNLLIEERDALGNTTKYAYDGNGNLIFQEDAKGQKTNYIYDALNRLTSKQYPGNTDTYSYDLNGNLTRSANKDISIRYKYDALNRLIDKTIENWDKTILYTYDKAGNRLSMTDPDGGITRYAYDANNRLTGLTTPQDELIRFIYDEGGRMIRQENSNGTFTVYDYDDADRLLSVVHRKSDNSEFASYTYTYDANGNRLTMTELDGGVNRYTYDGDNRLTAVTYADGTTEKYTFDAMGNRLKLEKDNETIEYKYDAADRLLEANNTQFSYDNNGNTIAKIEDGATTKYLYNGENRLVGVTLPDGKEESYQYDPFGNRISKSVTGEEVIRYLLDGDNVLQELSSNNAVVAHYTAGLELDNWLVMHRRNTTQTYHADGLGSITTLTADNGTLTASYNYDAYGNFTDRKGEVENAFTYTGREWDVKSGMYYYRSRFYDCKVGRFIKKDEFPGFHSRPLSLNKYAYVESNPIIYSDPTGEFIPILIGIGIKLVGGLAVRTIAKAALVGAVTDLGIQYLQFGSNLKCYSTYSVLFGALGGATGLGIIKNASTIRKIDNSFSNVKKQYKHFLNKIKSRKYTENDYALFQIYEKQFMKLSYNRSLAKGRLGASIISNATAIAGAYNTIEKYSDCDLGDGIQEIIGTKDSRIVEIIIDIIRPIDPNEILPPPSYGPEKWVSYQANLPYTILFENDPDFATAAAQKVKITHAFDENINPFSFRLGSFGFGDYVFEVPANLSYYSNQFDFSDSLGLVLKVIAGVDIAQNEAFWTFESVDPITGLAASLPAEAGFLPVNDTLIHNGEGFVNFTIQPKIDSKTGDEIKAKAAIVFDGNPAILTNEVFNTIDANHPESQIITITPSSDKKYYDLEWSGGDVGSGIGAYALYTSTNKSSFAPYISNLTDSTYRFIGYPDSTYQFFVRSKDNVNNLEALKFSAEPACMSLQVKELKNATDFKNNGSLEIDVLGGEGKITYQWSHNANLVNAAAEGLTPGDYEVTATDTTGCSVKSIITIGNDISTSIPRTSIDGLGIYNIYPVPADDILTIEFTSNTAQLFLTIHDMNGRQIRQQMLDVEANRKNQIVLSIGDLGVGSYILSLRSRVGVVKGLFVKMDK